MRTHSIAKNLNAYGAERTLAGIGHELFPQELTAGLLSPLICWIPELLPATNPDNIEPVQ